MPNTTCTLIRLLCIAYFYSLLCPANAQVYSWTDDQGNRVYSDKKPPSQSQASPSVHSTTGSVNYYTAPTVKQPVERSIKQTTAAELNSTTHQEHAGSIQSDEDKQPVLTEQQCQQHYRRNCDQVHNWRKYALEQCGDDSRCQNEEYLDQQYRPRTTEEVLAVARRAAARKAMRDKDITQFLTKRYTQYCDNQAKMYCKNKRSKQCKKMMAGVCDESRNLRDVFSQYDNLTPLQKQQIVNKAKQLSMASGKNQKRYDKILSDIIQLFIMQQTMGL